MTARAGTVCSGRATGPLQHTTLAGSFLLAGPVPLPKHDVPRSVTEVSRKGTRPPTTPVALKTSAD